VAFKAWLVLCL